MKFRFNGRSLMTLLVITSVFLLSGTLFLVSVAFGLFGLSRILIYFRLAEFTYNQSFVDNLFYYGSYIVSGYFLLVFIEYIFDELKVRYPDFKYFQGYRLHTMVILTSSVIFYIFIQMNYSYIHINFLVTTGIIAVLYALTELFYPDSRNLNQSEDDE